MRPDLIEAQRFLTALDEGSDSWSFQTFADDGSGRRQLSRLLHGSLDTHGAALAQLNERGAGVFVTVNHTDGQGRKKANIKRVRALFVDLDGAPIEPVLSAPTPPHIVVQSSPGRFHAYWRVSDCPVDACEPALKEMIGRFGGDPACCDLNRVLRLPGFLHRKADPFLVRVIENRAGEYRLSDLGIAVPTEEGRGVPKSSSVSSASSVGGWLDRYLPATTGERNRCLFGLARFLRGQIPNATKPELRRIVEQWHCRASAVIGTADFSTSWGDFHRSWESVRTPHGEILKPILERVDMDDEVSDGIDALGYGPSGRRLVRICEEMQRKAGEEPFFISARVAGDLIGVHFTDASKMLNGLVVDGVLELVKRGTGKVASRYRYIWPGEAAAVIPDDHRHCLAGESIEARA